MKYYHLPILCGLALLVCGCGPYSFSASGKSEFQSVHVSQIENKTIEYELADRLYDAIIASFIQDNTVQVLEQSKADAWMTGALLSYRRDPYNYDQQDAVSQYAVKVTLQVRVVKANSEDVIWEETFYAEGIYDADAETEVGDGQRIVIEKLTANILDKTTKSW